jgi:hypothetical protein
MCERFGACLPKFTDRQSSYWQEKFDSVSGVIKSFVFAALAVEAVLTFLIAL